MTLLLDTHALIWWLADHPSLPGKARQAIAFPGNRVYVSHVSAWEIAIKRRLGKIEFPLEDFEDILVNNQFDALPIRLSHILSRDPLPWQHRDPFDRLLIAQARDENMTLVSGDERMKDYPVDLLWDGG